MADNPGSYYSLSSAPTSQQEIDGEWGGEEGWGKGSQEVLGREMLVVIIQALVMEEAHHHSGGDGQHRNSYANVARRNHCSSRCSS
jgi:hypothetical protein